MANEDEAKKRLEETPAQAAESALLKQMAEEALAQPEARSEQGTPEKVFDIERDVTKEDLQHGAEYYRQISEEMAKPGASKDSPMYLLASLKGVNPNLDVSMAPGMGERLSEKLDAYRKDLSSEFWQTATIAKAIAPEMDLELPANAQELAQKLIDGQMKNAKYGATDFIITGAHMKEVGSSIEIAITEEAMQVAKEELAALKSNVLKKSTYSMDYLDLANSMKVIDANIDNGLDDEVLQKMKDQLDLLRQEATLDPKKWIEFFALADQLKDITANE